MKASSLKAIVREEWLGTLQKHHSQIIIITDSSNTSQETHTNKARMYLIGLRAISVWKTSSLEAFVKNNHWQLFNIALDWGRNKNLSKQKAGQKNLKGKGERWDVHWGY